MIHLTNICKQHGAQILFQDASLQILPATRTGLVGPNGAGKTTIFRLVTGEEETDRGEISCAKKTVIGYFSQDIGEMTGRSALAEVMSAAGELVEMGQLMREMEALMSKPMADEEMAALLERYGDIVEIFEHRGGYDLDARAKAVLAGLGISPDDFERPVETFSGGWKMRIALAKILTINPDVLLLDEPTNHLDVESIVWLEEWLANDYKGALLMTCHDREFMNRVVNRIIEVANRTITTYSGNYDFYLQERSIRRDQLAASFRRQQEMLAKEEEFIARFAARASHASQVQSRIKKLEKIERIELPTEQRIMHFDFPVPPRSGANLSTGYFSQHAMDILRPDHTVFEAVQEAMPLENIGVIRNLCAAFLFQGDDIHKRITNLSGGEKSRVVLAKLLAQPLNFLILDEPTNHLDIHSREVLLQALQNFDGTIILVSHDRHFLRSLVNRVFEIDHGEMRIFEGNYDDYLRRTGNALIDH